MNENRKDCKWMEILIGYYAEDDKCLCHLNPESKRVNPDKDCINCANYEKKEDEDGQ